MNLLNSLSIIVIGACIILQVRVNRATRHRIEQLEEAA